jgi:hypothetical protein
LDVDEFHVNVVEEEEITIGGDEFEEELLYKN